MVEDKKHNTKVKVIRICWAWTLIQYYFLYQPLNDFTIFLAELFTNDVIEWKTEHSDLMQNECPAKWRMKQGNKIQELDMNEQYLCFHTAL